MRNVLIVEDYQPMREIIAAIVKKIDPRMHIEQAANGHEGYSKFQSLVPDIIITDFHMPKCNGEELADLIRVTEKGRKLKLYLLTSAPEDCKRPELFDDIFDKSNTFLLKKQLLKDYYGRRKRSHTTMG